MKIEQICAFFERYGIDVTEGQLEQLKKYLLLLREWNEKVHLISKGDVLYLEERHILPSFVFAEFIRSRFGRKQLTVIDLGSGAGLPGVVLSILFPENHTWLIDSSRKKTLFLQKVKNELNIDFEVVNERFENWERVNQLNIDVITARAVASLAQLIKLTSHVLKAQKAKLVTMKSCHCKEALPDPEKKSIKMEIVNNNFWQFSEYLKDKCLVSLRYVHG